MKKFLVLALGLFLIATPEPSLAADALKPVRIVIPRASIFVLSYFGARDAGVFKKHGIDIQIDERPFAGFMASFPSRDSLVGTFAGLAAIERMNQGSDIVVVGAGLTVMQEVFVRADSPIKSVAELRGKRFGIFSTGAGASKSLRAVVIDGFGLDLLKDTKLVEAAGPALMGLMDKGELDAMYNLSSLTISALAQPEKFRSIFNPDEYWKKKTGVPIAWSAPIFAWRDWIQEDPDRARRTVAALTESFQWLRENSDAAIKKYGVLAAVKTPAEAEVYKKWLKEQRFFLERWDAQVINAQWEFLELAKRVGVLQNVPPKEKHALVLR